MVIRPGVQINAIKCDALRADPCRGAIETERTRLMKAEAILSSVAFSLTYAEWRCERGTDYANVVEIAREILQESIRQTYRVGLLVTPMKPALA